MKIVAFLYLCCPYLQLRSHVKAEPDYVTEKCTTETHFGKQVFLYPVHYYLLLLFYMPAHHSLST